MPAKKYSIKVFLCHASLDKPIVRELAQRLTAEGWVDVWLDENKLLPGQDWRLNIEQAMEASDMVIICLSSNSVEKEGVIQKELRYAREIALEKPEETIFLIPLRLNECDVPRGLRFYQWADYFGEKTEETYRLLLKSLKIRLTQKLKVDEDKQSPQEKEKSAGEITKDMAQEKNKPAYQQLDEPTEKVVSNQAKYLTPKNETGTIGNNYAPKIQKPEIKKYDIFLSYAAADKDDARKINSFLAKKKLKVFLSEKEIKPGSKWEEEIKEALKNSGLMCILATPNSLKSEWVTTEWAVAWASNIRILPILLRCSIQDLPDRLKAYQAIDFHNMTKIIELIQ